MNEPNVSEPIRPSTLVQLPGVDATPPDAAGPTPEEAAAAEARTATAVEALRDVIDPELGIDVVAMGLVYDIRVVGRGVEVDMTLTTPGCPVSESLPVEAAQAVRAALPDCAVDLHIVWDPPWTPERLSPEATAALGLAR